MENFGCVNVMRTFGKTKLYTLNAESEVVKKLLKLEFELIKHAMGKEAASKEAVPVPV